MLESEIKQRGTKLLESWNWEVVHIIQCNKNGYPDTIILRKSIAYFIEWKRPGQSPRDLQLYRHQKLKEQGFTTFVITDLKQLERFKDEEPPINSSI
jgi:hypothetical protein